MARQPLLHLQQTAQSQGLIFCDVNAAIQATFTGLLGLKFSAAGLVSGQIIIHFFDSPAQTRYDE
jgi:putative Mn2+ efflux pump MntP